MLDKFLVIYTIILVILGTLKLCEITDSFIDGKPTVDKDISDLEVRIKLSDLLMFLDQDFIIDPKYIKERQWFDSIPRNSIDDKTVVRLEWTGEYYKAYAVSEVVENEKY